MFHNHIYIKTVLDMHSFRRIEVCNELIVTMLWLFLSAAEITGYASTVNPRFNGPRFNGLRI